MKFEDKLYHSNPLFSENIILKFGDEITLKSKLFVNESISRQVSPIIYHWFTFSGNLHRYETCWSVNELAGPSQHTNFLDLKVWSL